MHVCVRACMRACVRVCVRACVRACVRPCVCPSVSVHNMFVVFLSEEHQGMLFKAGHVDFAHVRGNARCQYLKWKS